MDKCNFFPRLLILRIIRLRPKQDTQLLWKYKTKSIIYNLKKKKQTNTKLSFP